MPAAQVLGCGEEPVALWIAARGKEQTVRLENNVWNLAWI